VTLALLLAGPAVAQPAGRLALKGGDRVVLVGSALVEREQFHGYLETRLTRRFPNASVTFRNLGWSGDTVRGEARTGGFRNPGGLQRLLKEVRAQKPTVLFVGYGTNESFAGPAGLPGFLEGFHALLDQLAPLGARVVVLSPTFHEDLGRPFPDPAGHNRNLERYTAALEKLAARRKLLFVDLFHPLLRCKQADPKGRLTTNGLLPSAPGYRLIAAEVERQLLGEAAPWSAELDRPGKVLGLRGARLDAVKAGPDGLRFDLIPDILPAPPPPTGLPGQPPSLRITGLPPGQHALRVNGREVLRDSAERWNRGVRLEPDPALEQTEKLRAAVVRKGRLFYRRWRPFNDFEEHWGYIGGDFKLYDAQIAEHEARIARLRRALPLHCQVVPCKGTE
jgi:lysophospholipase L1-like esterase